jgi:hypothetical protein
MDNILANFSNSLKTNVNKIETKAINDSNLSETEVLSIIAATAAVEGLTDGVVKSAKSCIKNFTDSFRNNQNTLVTRGFFSWLGRALSTVVNIVTKVVFSTVIFAVATTAWLASSAVSIITLNWQQLGDITTEYVVEYLGYGAQIFYAFFGEYDCYIRCDLWNCSDGC